MIKDEIKKLRDMTEALIDANNVLLENEQQWETAFKSVPESIFVVDIDYNVVYANDVLKNRLNREDFVGENCYEILTKLLSIKGLDALKEINKPIFFKCLNGWYSYSFSAIKEGNHLIGYTCVLKNENDKVMVEQELIRLNEELSKIKKECGYVAA